LVQVERGEDEYSRHVAGPCGQNLARRRDTVGHGHADVHQDDVRREVRRELDRLPSVGRLADDFQVVLGVDQRRERGAEQRLVVDDGDSGGHPGPSIEAWAIEAWAIEAWAIGTRAVTRT